MTFGRKPTAAAIAADAIVQERLSLVASRGRAETEKYPIAAWSPRPTGKAKFTKPERAA